MTYRALDLGATTLQIGLIQSAFSILPALLAVAIGRVVDRVGGSRFMIASMIALAVGGLIAAYSGGLVVLSIGQLIGPAIAAAILGGGTALAASVVIAGAAGPAPIDGNAVAATGGPLPDNPEGLVFLVSTRITPVAVGL